MRGSVVLTGVDGCNGALHDDHRKSIQTSQGVDDLLERRKFGHHVQENRDETRAILAYPDLSVMAIEHLRADA